MAGLALANIALKVLVELGAPPERIAQLIDEVLLVLEAQQNAAGSLLSPAIASQREHLERALRTHRPASPQ
jgi:hypothetical protein